MNKFDHRNRQATKEWLTLVLNRNGFLNTGQVIDHVQRPSRIGESNTSEFLELTIKYSPDSSGKKPSSCLIKLGKPERFEPCEKESQFYDFIRGKRPGSVLESYATSVDEELKSVAILIEDKSDAFPPVEGLIPPDIDTCERAVRVLAHCHSMWWNHPKLNNIKAILDPGISVLNVSHEMVSAFFDRLGDALSPSRRAIIELSLELYPSTLQRRMDETNRQTVVHGDSHFWNFLFPKDDTKTPTLIDWQSWNVDFAMRDLAYMIVLYWFPERRSRYENRMLTSYLEELHNHGIEYSRDDMWYDYRMFIAGLVLYPCYQGPTRLWWYQMERLFCAFEDLDCREILDT